jgi:hypothetical protein
MLPGHIPEEFMPKGATVFFLTVGSVAITRALFSSPHPKDATVVKTALVAIAAVRAGIAFREAVRHDEKGSIAVIQAGDIGPDGRVDGAGLLRVSQVPLHGELPKISPGEVLLQSRGQTYRAGLAPTCNLPMVATASVLVITPKPAIQPAFLAYFLNDPVTQGELRKLATGATIANLKKSAVEQLEVLVPSLADQEKIVALGESLRHLSRIEHRLAELRRIELRALLEERARRNRGR